jgi:hypothetical protein
VVPRIEKLSSFQREGVSEATRRLLCDFAAGDPLRPLERVDVDWEELFQAVCRNGLLALAHQHLEQQPSDDYPPPHFRQWIKQAKAINAVQMETFDDQIRPVLASLNDAGIDYLVVKGPAVARLIYPNPGLRSFTDLDLVVRERDWAAVHPLMMELGFRSVENLPEPPPKLARPMVSHGLQYWDDEAQFLVEVHFDDLLESGLASRDLEGFWQRVQTVGIEGVPFKVLSLEDQLITLSAHVHYHGYTRLSWLSDIAFIIRDHAADLDWKQLIETVRREEVQVPVYFTLRMVERLLGVGAPASAMVALRPDRIRCWFHERYLPEDRVVSLQPMACPSFSFYFIPLFNRLLPDLLVMGRRKEKISCLLRLVCPSPAWLRYYYRVPDGASVGVHYLLHPLKLAYHYLAEVVVAARRLVQQGRITNRTEASTWWSFSPPSQETNHARKLLDGLGWIRERLTLAKSY